MINKIHHIGVAVQSITEALKVFGDALGLAVTHTEVVETQKVRVAFLPIGETCIELLEPAEETGPVANFLSRRGEGLHHICLEVEDIEAMLAELKQRGMRLVDEQPRRGIGESRIAFVHPSSAHGVLLELWERGKCL